MKTKSKEQIFKENIKFLNDLIKHFRGRLKRVTNEDQREFCRIHLKTLKEGKQTIVAGYLRGDINPFKENLN